MTDVVDKQTRSRMMSGIRGKGTKPELVVRAGLERLGYDYEVNVRALPGTPDLVLPDYKAVIFVNGCFWHHHSCNFFKWPATRRQFWRDKIEGNEIRDGRNLYRLKVDGWRVLIMWECAIKGQPDEVVNAAMIVVANWLESDSEFFEVSSVYSELEQDNTPEGSVGM